MAQRSRGRGYITKRKSTPQINIKSISNSDEESDQRGARIPFDYSKLNPPKFDLTSDLEDDFLNTKHEKQEDVPELTMYEKLGKRIEALSLIPLSSGKPVRLIVKEAPNLSGEMKKVQKFFSGTFSSRDNNNGTLEENDYNELMKLSFGYFHTCVKNEFSKGSSPYQWTKGQARYHGNIWSTGKVKNNTYGIGFGTIGPFDDDE